MQAHGIGTFLVAMTVGFGSLFISAQTRANEALAEQSGCMECHNINRNADRQVSGPAFRDITAKYRNTSERSSLIQVLKKGGKGKWPESAGVPMPPYSPRLTDAEIQRLIDWILNL